MGDIPAMRREYETRSRREDVEGEGKEETSRNVLDWPSMPSAPELVLSIGPRGRQDKIRFQDTSALRVRTES